MIFLFFLLLPPANMERQQTMPEPAKIGSSWLIWHFRVYFYLFVILKFTFQCPPVLGRIECACHADISQDLFQLLLISRLCWHISFPVSICHLSPFSFFFFSKSTNKFFCKRPFTDVSSFLCRLSSLSFSLAAANLIYLSAGTNCWIFSLSRPVLQISLGTPSWKKRWWWRQSRGFTLKYRSSRQQLWPLNNKKLRNFTFLICLIKMDDTSVG